LLPHRRHGLVGRAEDLGEPVVREVGGTPQFGGDQLPHLLLVQPASDEVKDEGMIPLHEHLPAADALFECRELPSRQVR
jgi:hypothetical protein